MSDRGSFSDFLLGVVIGGLVGYGAALLSAPKSGDEMRQMLTEKGRDIRENAMDTLQETKEKTGKMVAEGKDKVDQTMNRSKEKMMNMGNQGQGKVNEVRSTASDKLRDVADGIDPDKNPHSGPTSTPGF